MRKLLAFAILACSFNLYAQKTELGLWLGTSFYSGDYSPSEFGLYFNELSPAGGIFLRYNPANPISFKLGLNVGKVIGDDEVPFDSNRRAGNFRSPITELAGSLDVHLFRLGSPRKTQTVPYLTGGGALFRFNPQVNYDGNWIDVQPLGTEGQGAPGYEAPYDLSQFAVFAGGGIKFIIHEKLTIGLELSGRKTFTDYLDDVSALRINYLDVLENNGSLAATLSNPSIKDTEFQELDYVRGGNADDWYYFGGISFSFRLGHGYRNGGKGRNIGCPTF